MSASGQSIGGNAIIRSPHTAPRNMRHETIQELAGCKPLHPVTRSHGLAARNDHASFSSRSALKLSQFAQTMLDIASILLIAAFILLLFASPFIALGCLLFF